MHTFSHTYLTLIHISTHAHINTDIHTYTHTCTYRKACLIERHTEWGIYDPMNIFIQVHTYACIDTTADWPLLSMAYHTQRIQILTINTISNTYAHTHAHSVIITRTHSLFTNHIHTHFDFHHFSSIFCTLLSLRSNFFSYIHLSTIFKITSPGPLSNIFPYVFLFLEHPLFPMKSFAWSVKLSSLSRAS